MLAYIITTKIKQLIKQMSIFDQQLTEGDLDQLYNWIDNLPLSRPKKNINRDFSDAVMMAETINYYYPKLIQLHNYPSTNSIKSKIANWKTLSSKVLFKFGISLKDDECQKLASAVPMMVELLLHEFKTISAEEHKEKEQVRHNREQGNQRVGQQDGQQYVSSQEKGRKKQMQLRNMQVTKVEQLKQILKLLKQKIGFVQKSIQRKDAQIKELEDIIQLGL